jgi:hypothetical protein
VITFVMVVLYPAYCWFVGVWMWTYAAVEAAVAVKNRLTRPSPTASPATEVAA